MNKKEIYREQVRLLLSIIPIIDEEKCFALKGGTAINLFYRPFPRMSVDIDLLYLPIENRETSIDNINAALGRIVAEVKAKIRGVTVQDTTKQQDDSKKLLITKEGIRVKVELSPVIRGSLFDPVQMPVHTIVEEKIGYAEMLVASHPDLYAGKLCAALDRQHPRDLFDVLQLYENEGLTDDLRKAFLVFLISHHRPMSELLNPTRKDISQIYETEFIEMAEIDIPLQSLIDVRERLIKDINDQMTVDERNFLLSVKSRQPDFNLLGLQPPDFVANLPSVRWKLMNLDKMSLAKHQIAYEQLRAVLYP